MKICLIAKYPPIEGGESSKTYWLVRALGELGHEIHVVTNAWEVEDEYREQINADDLDYNYQPKGVYVHNTDPFIDPAYIPYSVPYTEKLASLAIDIIREHDIELIDSWYILPYVIAGFIAKTITRRIQIMRHAGSDMSRLLASPYLKTLFVSIFKKVDKIVTYPSMRKEFLSLGITKEKLFYNTKVSVDTKFFNPDVKPCDLSKYTEKKIDCPVITYFGKVGLTKGIYELVEAATGLKEDFILLFVCRGKNLVRFKEFVKRKNLQDKTLFIRFVPPWLMPSLIKRSTCVVIPERDFPVIQHTPILPREVMAVGKCLLLSDELYSKRVSKEIKDGENLLVVNPKNIKKFRSLLKKVIKSPEDIEEIGRKARDVSKKIERFEDYVSATIKLYNNLLRNSQA